MHQYWRKISFIIKIANNEILIQGTTIKGLVNLLNIDKKKDEQKLITEEVNDAIIEHVMSGVDVIAGKKGHAYWQVFLKYQYFFKFLKIYNLIFQTLFEYYDEHYLKKIFCNQKPENELTRLFEKLALT